MTTKKFLSLVVCLVLINLISACVPNQEIVNAPGSKPNYDGKKVLYIDSYHEGYEWSDGVTRGVVSGLEGTGVELKIHRMDTKINPSEEFKTNAGIVAKEVIEEFAPDVVITSDDNAFKYLVMPLYKDAELPFVFCGVNWDASVYDAPYSNTAGMIEVSLVPPLIDYLKEYAKGDKIGYLSGDVLTNRKEAENYKNKFDISVVERYVSTSADWKKEFLALQDEVDMLILYNNAGVNDWDIEEMTAFVESNVKVPIGATLDWMMPYSLIGLTVVPEEQGEYAAATALRILDGEKPADIATVQNKKGNIMINLKIAEKLGVTFSPAVLKNVNKVIE